VEGRRRTPHLGTANLLLRRRFLGLVEHLRREERRPFPRRRCEADGLELLSEEWRARAREGGRPSAHLQQNDQQRASDGQLAAARRSIDDARMKKSEGGIHGRNHWDYKHSFYCVVEISRSLDDQFYTICDDIGLTLGGEEP
jgi:hypothetical protein